jgi:hypothetical protein
MGNMKNDMMLPKTAVEPVIWYAIQATMLSCIIDPTNETIAPAQ